MGFIRMEGVQGLVYVPEPDGKAKKHPCEDCFSCQMCSDNRCDLCLKAKARAGASSPVKIITPDSIKHR